MKLRADRHTLQHKGTIGIHRLEQYFALTPQQDTVAFDNDDIAGKMRDACAAKGSFYFSRVETTVENKMNFSPSEYADVDDGNVALDAQRVMKICAVQI
jgi:hypothetical protein